MVALHHRERTGQGQCVDTALYESAFSLMESFVPAYEKLGEVPMRTGSRLPGHVPNNLFPTGDGSYIHIAAGHDRSEEHTSELQSLMRISYAVFCLTKKQNKTQTNNYISTQ